jgi:hypothetical protein
MKIISDVSNYRNHPDIRWQGRTVSVNMHDYTVKYSINGVEKEVIVPKGFRADGSSFANISALIGIHSDGRNRPAWLIHDYLYEKRIGTRKEADLLFYHLLKVLNMGDARAFAAYWSVRLFGGSWWKK